MPLPLVKKDAIFLTRKEVTSMQDIVESGTALLCQANTQSVAYKLRYIWIPNALSDPCLFHSSLYGASAHFDALNGQTESPITLFHRTETLRLLKNQLAHSGQVDDLMVAAALTMAHMEVRQHTCVPVVRHC